MEKTIRVLLADEFELIRNGIRLVLEKDAAIRVVGEAGDSANAAEKTGFLSPDVVVIDTDRSDDVRALKRERPEVRVLILSQCRDEVQVATLIRAGADAYLLKQGSAGTLIRTIRALVDRSGRSPILDPQLKIRGRSDERQSSEVLSQREREVLTLVVAGHTSKRIARRLQLSSRTVDNHRARIMAKLQVDNCVQAAARALQLGLIASPSEYVSSLAS